METPETAADGLIVRGRPPFAMTPTSLLRNPTISSHAVRLWSVLASYTYGDQATDRPSRAQLAADVGWKSVRSVDTYLAQLQDAGYLTVQQRRRNDRGRARSLYILEWEPNNPDPQTDIKPTSQPGAAGQTPVQNSAQESQNTSRPFEDNPVCPGQTPAQKVAHGLPDGRPPVQDFAPAPAQDPAQLRKEPQTKKEQPPPGPLPGPGTGGPIGPLAAGSPADVDALLRVIRQHLPDHLCRQLTTSTLKSRVEALNKAGWNAPALASILAVRTWNGAGPGAVITWLGDLARDSPVASKQEEAEDSRTRTLRARAAHAAVLAAAAPVESPARQQARALCAHLKARGVGDGEGRPGGNQNAS